MATQTTAEHKYYVPTPAPWPFMMTISLLISMVGGGVWLNGAAHIGSILSGIGLVLVIAVTFLWLRSVVHENLAGVYSHWEDRTFRIGMCWFIFSEVMF